MILGINISEIIYFLCDIINSISWIFGLSKSKGGEKVSLVLLR